MYESILRYRGSRYLWYALGLLIASLCIYLSQDPAAPPSGSTWQGYLLGGIGAVLIIWLNLLGIRKRRYGKAGQLEGWVSAHVYLGSVLLGVALLHSAGQIGWNVHTATLLLMIISIVSGAVGLFFYASLPRRLADNRKGLSRNEMFGELEELDSACVELAEKCGPATALQVGSSIEKTTLGGGLLDQLFARDKSTFIAAGDSETDGKQTAGRMANVDQRAILELIARSAPVARADADADAHGRLVPLIARRQALLSRIRKDIQLQGRLKIWLYVHVPISVALLVALVIHVLVVFLYW